MGEVVVKFRVPASIGTFWYPDPKRPSKEVEAKGGDVVEVPERIARLYGWSPDAVQKEAEELQRKADEAAVLAASARAAADAAAKQAAEAKATAEKGKTPSPAADAAAKGGKA